MNKIVLHIDMNSYFASVEQQANPFLRGKPIVVSGKEDSRTVIVAASVEAKKFGVKTAMSVFEAKKLCPHLYFIQPDPEKYAYVTDSFLKIFKKHTSEVELFSIDEAFLDLTNYVKNFKQAEKLAEKIKKQIQKQIGEWIRCSIGISFNRQMAKLASDMKKPDGLVLIEKKDRFKVLDFIKVDDLCGLGPRLAKRLDALGLNDLKKVRQADKQIMLDELGPYWAPRLRKMAAGELDEEIVPYYEEEQMKSAGASYTLPQNTFNKNYLYQILIQLIEKVCRRLRKNNLRAKTTCYFFRFEDFTHWEERRTWAGYLSDEILFFEWAKKQIEKLIFPKSVRLIGFRADKLMENNNQLPLFIKDRKKVLLTECLDKINNTYGERTIFSGVMLDAPKLKKRAGGFKFEI